MKRSPFFRGISMDFSNCHDSKNRRVLGYPHLFLASISPDEMSNPKMSSTQLAPRDQVSTIELVKEDPVAMVDAKLQQNVHHDTPCVFLQRSPKLQCHHCPYATCTMAKKLGSTPFLEKTKCFKRKSRYNA